VATVVKRRRVGTSEVWSESEIKMEGAVIRIDLEFINN